MKKYIILIPVYNDWKSVFKLLENIDLQIKDWDGEVSVLIVNDASTDESPLSQFDLANQIAILGIEEGWGIDYAILTN